MKQFDTIVAHFAIQGTVQEVVPLGNGLINKTLKVFTRETDAPHYVLQQINNEVFKDVNLLQNNIAIITNHIRKKWEERGEKDLLRKVLTVVPAIDGKNFYFDGNSYWRMMLFIENSVSYEAVTSELAYKTGLAFGEFQDMLSDLNENILGETIPNFHNMEFRIKELQCSISTHDSNRLAKVQPIVDELLTRAEVMCQVQRLFRNSLFPKRITHCDTKVNNILFDQECNPLTIIDLDTTMPGFVLSDYGDFLRTAGNFAAEDEKDTAKIGLNMEVFRNFTLGYLKSASSFLTPIEIKYLPFGAQMMTYMQTVRFLTDYLNGDTYYKINFPEHNWQRTLAQRAMLHSIDHHFAEMNDYIDNVLNG